jgi:hypothetical protein
MKVGIAFRMKSLPVFPANREFYREFLKNRGLGNPRDSKKSPRNTAFDLISLAHETGNYFCIIVNPGT